MKQLFWPMLFGTLIATALDAATPEERSRQMRCQRAPWLSECGGPPRPRGIHGSWEEVGGDSPHVGTSLHRMNVPGGWLYLVTRSTDVAVAFVPLAATAPPMPARTPYAGPLEKAK